MEAKQLISSTQRDVCDLKREATDAERSTRAAGQDARLDVVSRAVHRQLHGKQGPRCVSPRASVGSKKGRESTG